MAKRKTDRRARDLLLVLVPSLLVTILGFVVAYQFVEPAPPKVITMAAGPTEGAYHGYALQYKEALAVAGIELQVLETRGSRENLQLLAQDSGEVDIALTQGGTGSPKEFPSLLSLGAVFFEPLWIFVRGTPPEPLRGLRGRRLAVGVQGSGTQFIARQLLQDNGIGANDSEFVELGARAASEALKGKQVDAAFFIGAPNSPVIDDLLRSDAQLMSMHRAPAYARQRRFLSGVQLLAGVFDLEQDIPPTDVDLLAPAASLTVKDGFHPALVGLFLECATDIHGSPGLFEKTSLFPCPLFADYPLNEEAERFLKKGPSFLNRFLPFWAANLVDRTLVMLIPLLTLLIPLLKVFPPLYSWRIRSRFKNWYRDLQAIDFSASQDSELDRAEAIAEVERIERELALVTVPPSYGDELYHLRFHVTLVREKLTR